MSKLKILDFAVIIRNIVDIGKSQEPLETEDIRDSLSAIIPPETEAFAMTNNVFQAVCSLAKKDLTRFELPSLEVLDKRGLFYCSDEIVVEKFDAGPRHKVDIYPSIHRSGTMIVNNHIRLNSSEGMDVNQAIECTRLNLRTLAIELPHSFIGLLDFVEAPGFRWIRHGERAFLIGSLKDFASDVLRPIIRKLLQKHHELESNLLLRCISSTLLQIYKTDPLCESVDDFVTIDKFGREIKGIGSLDRSYEARTGAMVAEALTNLSTDEELGVFTFGLSDLLLCDDSFEEITDITLKNKKIQDRYSAVLYNTSHYSTLLEWIYLEKFIIDRYNRLLSQAIGQEKTTPDHMLTLQKRSMHDLLVYKAGITPFPSREEFLERARNAHRIPEMQERLEKKRDLATDYVIQEYTLRTNKGIQLVNIFVSATAVFGLMEVILSIVETDGTHSRKLMWAAITAGLFISVLAFLTLSMKFFTQGKRK